ncbi:ABC transporter transmembrane domain-containing protein [Glutamicibacter sp. NPDC127525]|uniref:ABC transporter transmembrane domain-containing protein n=1 Tax=unclassified Glutamicibacter TaxID=2627139 RepID=UPI00363A9C3A
MSSSMLTGRTLLRGMLRAERGRIIGAIALLSCWTAGEALVPALVGATIDHAIAGQSLPLLVAWLAALGLCFLMLSSGYRLGARLGNSGMNRQVHLMRTRIAEHVMDPGYRPATARMPGEIAAITSVDTTVTATIIRQASLGFSALAGLLVCAGYLLWANLWVGLAVLAITPLGMAALRWLTPRLSRASDRLQSDIAASGAAAADLMAGVQVLRGIGGQDQASERYRAASRSAATAGVASASATGRIEGAQVLISGLVLLSAASLSAWQVAEGAMGIGTLLGVLGVAQFLSTPLGTLVSTVEAGTRSIAAADRVAALLADGGRQPGTRRPAAEPDAALALDVPGLGERPLVFVPGRFTVLVCANDSMRHRLAKLLSEGSENPGTAAVREGTAAAAAARLLVDGIDAAQIDPAYLPQLLRMAPHQAHLIEGSVKENIVGDAALPDPQTLQLLLRASGVDELLGTLPDGLEHQVQGRGHNLSGGQRQRIALARALSGGPLARVLHDPTSAVDSVTEANIAQGLVQLRAHAASNGAGAGTLLVLSTSPTLLHAADEVLFLAADGSITRSTHRALAENTTYEKVVGR